LDNKLMMTTSIYKISKSLGKFCAFKTNHVGSVGIYGEINNYGIDQYYDGQFEANIYHDGELTDIELNGWTFRFYFKGNYHEPGTFYTTSFEIECLDPNENELVLYSTPYKVRFSEKDVLCNYLDLINIYSQFENADIATKFNILSRLVDEGMYGARGRVPMKITYGGVLDLIKFFREYYEKLGEAKDELLLEKIKEVVNSALDFLKIRLNFDKIE